MTASIIISRLMIELTLGLSSLPDGRSGAPSRSRCRWSYLCEPEATFYSCLIAGLQLPSLSSSGNLARMTNVAGLLSEKLRRYRLSSSICTSSFSKLYLPNSWLRPQLRSAKPTINLSHQSPTAAPTQGSEVKPSPSNTQVSLRMESRCSPRRLIRAVACCSGSLNTKEAQSERTPESEAQKLTNCWREHHDLLGAAQPETSRVIMEYSTCAHAAQWNSHND